MQDANMGSRRRPAYSRAHRRVRALRGKPWLHLCVDCGKPAKHWSLSWRRAAKLEIYPDGTHAYSDDVRDYDPRCRPCHLAYDAGGTAAGVAAAGTADVHVRRVKKPVDRSWLTAVGDSIDRAAVTPDDETTLDDQDW